LEENVQNNLMTVKGRRVYMRFWWVVSFMCTLIFHFWDYLIILWMLSFTRVLTFLFKCEQYYTLSRDRDFKKYK